MTLLRNNQILTKNARMASTLFQRTIGLLGKTRLDRNEALILSPCRAVHTFFMKFSIDVAFLKPDGTIVSLYPNLKPYRMTWIYPGAHSALEFPAGTIEQWQLEKGQKIMIQNLEEKEKRHV